MKKYLAVAILSLKQQFSFRFDILTAMLIALMKVLFAMIVWGAVFGAREDIAGFTLSNMITYYVVSALLTQLDMSDNIGSEVSGRIRDGGFSKYMILPINIERQFLWQTLGSAAVYFVFNLLAMALWVLGFGLEMTFASDPFVLLCAVLMVVLGLVFMAQFSFFLGLWAFKFQDVGSLLMIKRNIADFVTGAIVPLVLMPPAIVGAMRFLPFYYVTYLPTMLIIGRSAGEAVPGLVVITLWVFVFYVMNRVVYKHLRLKNDGVGI